MKQISYKWWYITRDDNGFITECAVRFYEGEDMDVEVENPLIGGKQIERRYVRTKRLTMDDIAEIKGKYRLEKDGSQARVYTSKDFGKIKTDDELRLFANNEMDKHKGRKNQKDQAELLDVKNVK